MNFPSIRFLKIIYNIFYLWTNFIKISFKWFCFISISIAFIFNIISAPKVTYYCWFIIINFFCLKKFPNISNYFSLITLFSLFSLKKFLISLKELRNYNCKVFLCRLQKYAKTQPTLQTAVSQNKFTLWHIKLNVYRWKNEFASHKQYLFGLLFCRNTCTDQIILPVFFTLSGKKRLTNFNSSNWKELFPKSVCN